MSKSSPRTVELNLEPFENCAFKTICAFTKRTRKAGWHKSQTAAVLSEALNGDRTHFFTTIQAHCTPVAEHYSKQFNNKQHEKTSKPNR